MDIQTILRSAVENKASDIFIISNLPVCFKIDGDIKYQGEEHLSPLEAEALIYEIYKLNPIKSIEKLLNQGDDDFSVSVSGLGRFRINAYRQRNTLAVIIRSVLFTIPDPKKIAIPDSVMKIAEKNKGLVLVTGSSGSGKSTTLACIVDRINKTRGGHIITLEDPMEFIHKHNKSIVSQREIASDTDSYVVALRAALRQAPNVILLGEMRDFETISIAMTAAETGQLVLSSLHTIGAANTVDRIIDVFSPEQQHQIRQQLSMVLSTVVSQQLLPSTEGTLVPAFEIMHVNAAIRNMIREQRIHQIDTAIYAGSAEDMITMDQSIFKLWKKGTITAETAVQYSVHHDDIEKKIGQK